MGYLDQSKAEINTDAEALRDGFTETRLWLKKIEAAKTDEVRLLWMKDSRRSIATYEAGKFESETTTGANLWHSNIQTLAPAFYNSTPIPDIRVRHGDKDPVAMAVGQMLERVLSFDLDQYDYDGEMKEIVRHRLTTGLGVPRIIYEPEIEEQPGQDGNPQEVILRDDVKIETVPWDRFIQGPARSWSKVQWICFEHDMTLEDIAEINKTAAKKLTADRLTQRSNDNDSGNPEDEDKGIFNTLVVYEVWDKRSKTQFFITPQDEQNPIEVRKDPLGLKGFFPVPRPLTGIRRVSSLNPLCGWTVYKGLFEEFERTTKRINGLVGQMRVRGIYDAEMEVDFESLRNCTDGQYVAGKNVAAFSVTGGGLDKAIWTWPLREIAMAVRELREHREAVKQLIFETTGVSDIIRGATNPNETLGAQKLKASIGSQRIDDEQKDVARLNRDIIRMKCEIRANLTPWRLLKEMSGMKFEPEEPHMPTPAPPPPQPEQQAMDPSQPSEQPPQPQEVNPEQMEQEKQQALQQAQEEAQAFEKQVEEMLKSKSRMIHIDIETDSTIAADMSADQEQLNMFVQATGQFAQAVGSISMVMPEVRGPMFGVYAALARKFRLGKQGEDALSQLTDLSEKMTDGAEQTEEQPPEVGPMEIEQLKAELQKELKTMDIEAEIARHQEMAQVREADQQKHQMEHDERRAEQDMKANIEEERHSETQRLERERIEFERHSKLSEIRLRAALDDRKLTHEARSKSIEHQARLREVGIKAASGDEQRINVEAQKLAETQVKEIIDGLGDIVSTGGSIDPEAFKAELDDIMLAITQSKQDISNSAKNGAN